LQLKGQLNFIRLFLSRRTVLTSASVTLNRAKATSNGECLATTDGLLITLPRTHEEISRHIGASRESVGRILSDWKQRGVIRVSGGSITIPNPKEFREAMASVRSR
jgi:CRP-like cAMP-binding protein